MRVLYCTNSNPDDPHALFEEKEHGGPLPAEGDQVKFCDRIYVVSSRLWLPEKQEMRVCLHCIHDPSLDDLGPTELTFTYRIEEAKYDDDRLFINIVSHDTDDIVGLGVASHVEELGGKKKAMRLLITAVQRMMTSSKTLCEEILECEHVEGDVYKGVGVYRAHNTLGVEPFQVNIQESQTDFHMEALRNKVKDWIGKDEA